MPMERSRTRFNWRKILLIFAKALVSITLLYLIFRKSSPDEILEIINTIPLSSFFLSVLLTLFSVAVATRRWKLFIPSNPPTGRLFSYYLIGTFFNTVMPGIIGGDAVKAYYLNRDEEDIPGTLASIFFERFLGYVSLIILCIVSYPFIYKYIAGSAIKTIFPAIIIAFFTVTALIFKTDLVGKFKFTSRFHSYLKLYVSQKKQIAIGLGYSLLIQCLYVLSVFILARHLRSDVMIIFVFAFFPVITTLSSLPLSISGVGIREASFVLLFGAIGWEPSVATALSLSWFLTLLVTGLFGLVEFLRIRQERPVKIVMFSH
jgi:uncharacterized membrane protein YbhN (UPF0104 family)